MASKVFLILLAIAASTYSAHISELLNQLEDTPRNPRETESDTLESLDDKKRDCQKLSSDEVIPILDELRTVKINEGFDNHDDGGSLDNTEQIITLKSNPEPDFEEKQVTEMFVESTTEEPVAIISTNPPETEDTPTETTKVEEQQTIEPKNIINEIFSQKVDHLRKEVISDPNVINERLTSSRNRSLRKSSFCSSEFRRRI